MTTTIAQSLAACPCCRSESVGFFFEGDYPSTVTGVTCLECGLRTVPSADVTKSINTWNHRAPRKTLRETMDELKGIKT